MKINTINFSNYNLVKLYCPRVDATLVADVKLPGFDKHFHINYCIGNVNHYVQVVCHLFNSIWNGFQCGEAN